MNTRMARSAKEELLKTAAVPKAKGVFSRIGQILKGERLSSLRDDAVGAIGSRNPGGAVDGKVILTPQAQEALSELRKEKIKRYSIPTAAVVVPASAYLARDKMKDG